MTSDDLRNDLAVEQHDRRDEDDDLYDDEWDDPWDLGWWQ